MPDELVAELDAAATRYDRPRAWIIRWACIAKMDEEQATQASIQRGVADAEAGRVGEAVTLDERARVYASDCYEFTPAEGNALRCASCGQRKGAH